MSHEPPRFPSQHDFTWKYEVTGRQCCQCCQHSVSAPVSAGRYLLVTRFIRQTQVEPLALISLFSLYLILRERERETADLHAAVFPFPPKPSSAW